MLVGDEEIQPFVRFTVVEKDVRSTGFVDLERWRKALKTAPAGAAFTLDEQAIARTERLGIAHVARLEKRNITLSR
jgi:hypothetical protein